MKLNRTKILLLYFIFGAVFSFSSLVFANSGVIDHSNNDNTAKVCHNVDCSSYGIINFELTQDTLVIDDQSGISGKVWGNELGWITMNPTNAGVFVDPDTGELSGKAWSQVSGWINFAPTGQTVVIDPDTGEFDGWAWSGGAYGGWIKFDCTNNSTCVKTTWRADSSSSGSGGGPKCSYPFTSVDGECVCEPPLVDIGGWCAYVDAFDDVCPNIDYLQVEVPLGMQIVDGLCVPIPLDDVCPNIPDTQTSIPFGMHITNGQCVDNSSGGCTGNCGENDNPDVVDDGDTTPPDNVGPDVVNDGGGGVIEVITNIINDVIDNIVNFEPVIPLDHLFEEVNLGLISRVLSTVGLLLAGISLWSVFDIGMNVVRLWSAFLYGMGFKKRNRPWGVVYDSVTKQPIDPAYVVLRSREGVEVATSITDLDGRYGFLVSPGFYTISVHKTNYIYPSTKLAGKTSDELYNGLYFGEEIEIKEEGEVITRNIPMDRINFDWNEFAKKEQKRMRFFHKWDVAFGKFTDIMFVLGFVFSVVALAVVPGPYNLIIFGLYLLMFLLRRATVGRNQKGNVSLKDTDTPISYGILRLSTQNGQEVVRRVLDRLGNYYCLSPNGYYIATIEQKNVDGTYTKIYTSEPLEIKKGILKKNFKI